MWITLNYGMTLDVIFNLSALIVFLAWKKCLLLYGGMLCCWQISMREAYRGTKKVGLGSFTRKTPVTATSYVDTSNNAHGVASHKPAAAATVAMTAAAPAAAAAAPPAATNWPQVRQICSSWPDSWRPCCSAELMKCDGASVTD